MFIQQEAEKWFYDIEEKKQEVNNKKSELNHKEAVLNMKIQLVSRVSDKLKTDLLEKLKEELKEVEIQIDYLNDVGHDLSLLQAHVSANFNLVK